MNKKTISKTLIAIKQLEPFKFFNIQIILFQNALSACCRDFAEYGSAAPGLIAPGIAGINGLAGKSGLAGINGLAGPYRAAYGGSGLGNVAIAGELPVGGATAVAGQVPIIGAVQFGGPVCAAGTVVIAGSCGCGCTAPAACVC